MDGKATYAFIPYGDITQVFFSSEIKKTYENTMIYASVLEDTFMIARSSLLKTS